MSSNTAAWRLEQLTPMLDDFLNMKPDWNTYGAEPPNETAVRNVKAFLECAQEAMFPLPRIFPSPIGGIELTWKKKGYVLAYLKDIQPDECEVSVEFDNSGMVSVFCDDGTTMVEIRNPSANWIGIVVFQIQNHLWC